MSAIYRPTGQRVLVEGTLPGTALLVLVYCAATGERFTTTTGELA